jgi:NTP pyrophosphatase (non-canonical NTP hydrolase)
MATMNKWTPTTDLLTLRRMGKLGEELGEAQAVAARVIIQGIDEVDPGSGKVNRQRLMDELADVQAQIGCTVLAFDLDQGYMARRTAEKMRQMAEWEALFSAPAA